MKQCGVCVYLRFRVEYIILLSFKLVFWYHPKVQQNKEKRKQLTVRNIRQKHLYLTFSKRLCALLISGPSLCKCATTKFYYFTTGGQDSSQSWKRWMVAWLQFGGGPSLENKQKVVLLTFVAVQDHLLTSHSLPGSHWSTSHRNDTCKDTHLIFNSIVCIWATVAACFFTGKSLFTKKFKHVALHHLVFDYFVVCPFMHKSTSLIITEGKGIP